MDSEEERGMSSRLYNNLVKIAFISALGNWLGDTILYPIDTISTRLKASKYVNHNPITFTISTIKNDGFKLFRGVQLTFPAAFIPTFCYVTVYDYGMKKIEHILHKYTDNKATKLFFPFFVSSFAEFLCLFPYLPVDTVRTRVQVQLKLCRWTILTTNINRFLGDSNKFNRNKVSLDSINPPKFILYVKPFTPLFNFRVSNLSDTWLALLMYGCSSTLYFRQQLLLLFLTPCKFL